MKPAQLANFLGHIGGPADDGTTAPRVSPFRPRSLHNSREEPSQPRPAFERAMRAIGAVKPRIAETADPPASEGAAEVERMAESLADAYARGRADGRAEASAEAAERRLAENDAAEERAAAERTAFESNEYARLEADLRTGLAEIADTVGDAVARILAPFLADASVRRAVEELRASVARLCAGGGPDMIRIRGPERVLRRLREAVADLPVEVEYAQDESIEATVEARLTRIVAELRPWAELLASLEA